MSFDAEAPSGRVSPSHTVSEDLAAPVLAVERLTVHRGSYVAIQDVSFDIAIGTDTAIVGPNGAGKSTLIQAVLGLIPTSGGAVRIFGRPVDKLGHLRHQIGYIPQNFIFDRNFPLSVSELVGLGWISDRQRHRLSPIRQFFSTLNPQNWGLQQRNPERKKAIAQSLERVGAYHLRHRAIGNLSGGELKRVLLAYCLVIPRRLLILDEAFAGVDVQGETDFYALLNQLKQEQKWTVLQISHDLDMVSRHCDRVLCLNRHLICHGQPDMALSAENLLHAYGPAFSRYQHHH